MDEINAIKVPKSYNGAHLRFPLDRDQVVNMYKAFRARKRLHAKYVMQLLEEYYIHADRNNRTLMESTIDEGTTMTICGDTHGQWEDFCTIMDMNGLPSESNRVRARVCVHVCVCVCVCVYLRAVGVRTHTFHTCTELMHYIHACTRAAAGRQTRRRSLSLQQLSLFRC